MPLAVTATILQLLALEIPAPAPPLARAILQDVTTAQLDAYDPRWPKEQRDCAGLVRYAYRQAALRLAPTLLERGLWRDRRGLATAFADAHTLLRADNFVPLGRAPSTQSRLETGDLVAFAQPRDPGREPVLHLMLVLRPAGASDSELLLIYHTGDAARGMRAGRLEDYRRQAPAEWQTSPGNPAFLGFFRYARWQRWFPAPLSPTSMLGQERQP